MTQQNPSIAATDVHKTLKKIMQADGYDLVLDLDKSKGAYLHDAKTGRDYLDFFTFFASNPLGMNHDRVAGDPEFVKELGRLAINKPSNSDIYTREMAEFVETFSKIGIPDYFKHLFLISGGTLAVENALKVAFDWKVRKNFEKGYRKEKGHKVLHLEQAFHGRSGYTLSLTNTDPSKTKYFPKFDWPRILSPAMRYPETRESVANVQQLERKALTQAERYFEIYKDDIACILLEPIQGEGGDNHFRLEFHKALRKLADRHDALLIYDEVQTGVGLTGTFWCHEQLVRPDIIAFGKKAQVCGILVNDRIDDVPENCFHSPSRINSTWGGSLVDMIRFQRILEVIEEDQLVRHAAEEGEYLQELIRGLSNEYEPVSNPRGRGLFCALDLPNKEMRDQTVKECLQNGLIIMGCGTKTIRFRPPLTIQREEIKIGIDTLSKSVRTVLNRRASKITSKINGH